MAFLFLVNKFRLCGGRHMTVTGYTSEKYNGRLDEELWNAGVNLSLGLSVSYDFVESTVLYS